MKGRKPRPTLEVVREGNPGKRRINKNEPKPEPVAPACPNYLSTVARSEWQYIAPKLEKLGLLTKIDRALLVAYCISYARMKEAEKFIAEHGTSYETVVRDKWGAEIARKFVDYPAVKMQKDAIEQMRKIAVEFGMSVSSRSRMTLPSEKDVDDDMERLLSGG